MIFLTTVLSNHAYEEALCERKEYSLKLKTVARAVTFKELLEFGNMFVDKTLFIKEIMEYPSKVTVITTPRAFGKTMNIEMLRMFLQLETTARGKPELISPAQTSSYMFFKNGRIRRFDETPLRFISPPLISKHTDVLDNHLARYPVIYLNLEVPYKYLNFDEIVDKFRTEISKEFTRYATVSDFAFGYGIMQKEDYDKFHKFAENNETDVIEIRKSVKFLSEFLFKYFNKRVIVLIDGYDGALIMIMEPWKFMDIRPIVKKKVINFYAGIFLSTFNDNEYVEKGVIMGNMAICPEHLFWRLNNVTVYDNMNNRLSRFFGFTRPEVNMLFKAAEIPSKLAEDAHKWYYGYNMNRHLEVIVYNPWSIVVFIDKEEILNYWENALGDYAMRLILKFPSMYHLQRNLATRKNATVLFDDTYLSEADFLRLEELVNQNMTEKMNNADVDIVLKRLCAGGYLTYATYYLHHIGPTNVTQIKVPNSEIVSEYRRILCINTKEEC